MKMKTQNPLIVLEKFQRHFATFHTEWEDYQNGKLSKKELLFKWSEFCTKECKMKIGKNGAHYVSLNKGTIERPKTTTKDIVWVDGDWYDFLFIRLERSTNHDIITFMKILDTAKKE